MATEIYAEDISGQEITLTGELSISYGLTKLELLHEILGSSVISLKNGSESTEAETPTEEQTKAIIRNVASFTVTCTPSDATWDTYLESWTIASDWSDCYFTMWDNATHSSVSKITLKKGSTFSQSFGTPKPKAESLTKEDTLYLFGNFPFDLTKLPITVRYGNEVRKYTYSAKPGTGEYSAKIVNAKGSDVSSGIMLDGSRPITNTEITSMGDGDHYLSVSLEGKTDLYEKTSDMPKVAVNKCIGFRSANIKPRQQVSADYIGKPIGEIPLDLVLQIQTSHTEDADGYPTDTYSEILKSDNVKLKGLAVSILDVPSLQTQVKQGNNATEILTNGSLEGIVNDTQILHREQIQAESGKTGSAVYNQPAKLDISTEKQTENPAEITLVVVRGTLRSLGLVSKNQYRVYMGAGKYAESTKVIDGDYGMGGNYLFSGQFIPNILNANGSASFKGYDFLFEEGDTENVGGENHLKAGLDRTKVHVYGVLLRGNTNANGNMILFDDWIPEYDGQNNIEVKYPCYVKGNADYIDKCRFGCMFGANNARNRLFVSGNIQHRNTDWHSAEAESEGDLSYFPDDGQCNYGQGGAGVTGYGIVSDGKLFVGMSYSDTEPSAYYRTASYRPMTDSDGRAIQLNGQSFYEETFAWTATSTHTAGIKPYLYASFNGDQLFVSANTHEIVGLDVKGVTNDTQRIASTRSYCIDSYIRDGSIDPEDCLLYTDGQELWYATPECLFVSDYSLDASRSAYEWFRLGIPNVTAMARRGAKGLATDSELAGKLYIGTENGGVYELSDDWCDYDWLDLSTDTDIRWDSEEKRFTLTAAIASKVKAGEYNQLWFTWQSFKTRCRIVSYDDGDGSDTLTVETIEGYPDYLGMWDDSGTAGQISHVRLVKASPVSSYYITAPMLFTYAHELKTVWSYTVFFDTKADCEVKLEQATNETTYDRMIHSARETGTIETDVGSIDLSALALGKVQLQKKRLPHMYTQYRPFVAPFFALTFSSSDNIDSVLTSAQISYSDTGNRYTGDSRS